MVDRDLFLKVLLQRHEVSVTSEAWISQA
jgi:hypothetical protein